MPTRTGVAVLKKRPAACPLVLVGSAGPRRRDLAQEARSAGLRVLAELPWPVSTPALQYALQTLQQPIGQIRPWNGTGYALLPSADGKVVSSPHAASIGKPLTGSVALHGVRRYDDPILQEPALILSQAIDVGNS